MKTIVMLLAALIALSAQTPAQKPLRTLVYQFGYNTPVAAQGNGTGTTTVQIMGAAPDGGMMVTGTDDWWNSARPRAANTCEVYSDGTVACSQAPNAISPIQLTLFPLLGAAFFKGVAANPSSSWSRTYTVKAAVLPGAGGYAGQVYTWKCTSSLQGKGVQSGSPNIMLTTSGTLAQQGGRYWKATSKQRIVYTPAGKIPILVTDTRTHIPMRSVYSNDLVELKILKDSAHK